MSDRAGRRRRIFEHFAASAGFDPLSPENWYMQSTEQILAAEVRSSAPRPFIHPSLLSRSFPFANFNHREYGG